MPVSRLVLAGLVCSSLFAQQTEDSTAQFRTSVEVVVVPVTAFDRDGSYVNGLQPYQFHLFDNGKEQDIKVDISYLPISLVICVQANDHVDSMLPQIRRMGTLVEPLVIGEQGEAAVVAFDHRVTTLQDFTSDPNKISEAFKKINAGSTSSGMIDAVMAGTRMLRSRPKNNRRILMLISETRDRGSEGRAREALIQAQLDNVTIYTVDISRFLTTLMARPQPPRPDPRPPAAHPLPAGVPATPNTVMQTYGTEGGRAEFIPMMVEVFKDVKAIFKDNPAEVFTKGTGGTEYGFTRQRDLERAFSAIGEELHSQYLITYNPNNKSEGGFHQITVQVAGRPDIQVRTRPGYWLGPK